MTEFIAILNIASKFSCYFFHLHFTVVLLFCLDLTAWKVLTALAEIAMLDITARMILKTRTHPTIFL